MCRGLAAGGGLGALRFRSRARTRPRRHIFFADILRIAGRDVHGDIVRQLLEVLGAGHEIALTVDLDKHADLAAGMDVAGHRPSLVTRAAFLAATVTPFLRRMIIACSMSPWLRSGLSYNPSWERRSSPGAPLRLRNICHRSAHRLIPVLFLSFEFIPFQATRNWKPETGNSLLQTLTRAGRPARV